MIKKAINDRVSERKIVLWREIVKRDMELMRKILFAIEDQYKPGDGFMLGLKIEDVDMNIIAEHCDLLYQQGLISDYQKISATSFKIGNLSARGYDYLELIRDEKMWVKTNEEVDKKKLPKTIEFITKIAGIFTGNMIKELNS